MASDGSSRGSHDVGMCSLRLDSAEDSRNLRDGARGNAERRETERSDASIRPTRGSGGLIYSGGAPDPPSFHRSLPNTTNDYGKTRNDREVVDVNVNVQVDVDVDGLCVDDVLDGVADDAVDDEGDDWRCRQIATS